MYMSKELWEEMLAQEKEKVQQLEDKFADKMRAAKVIDLYSFALL